MTRLVVASLSLLVVAGGGALAHSAHAPDLAVLAVDSAGLSGDWQHLVVSGAVEVQIRNVGDLDISDDFRVTVFEDADGDQVFDRAVDRLLSELIQPGLHALSDAYLTATVRSSLIPFRDSPIVAEVDTGDVVAELSERNNHGQTGQDCRRPGDAFAPGPDLTVSHIVLRRSDGPAAYRLTTRIGNGGAAPAAAGVPLVFRSNDNALGTALTSRPLGVGEFEDVGVDWPLPNLVRAPILAALGDTPGQSGDCKPANDSFASVIAFKSEEPSTFTILILPWLEAPGR